MERRLTGIILGILSSLIWPQVPSLGIALIILAVGLYLSKRQPLLSSVMIGISYCAVTINVQFNDLQYLKLQNSSITGTIISLPEQRKYNNRFFFQLSAINAPNVTRKSKAILLVYWPGQHQLAQGQQLALTVAVRPVYGLANRGGFNYQKWLISKGVIATARVSKGAMLDNNIAPRAFVADRVAATVGQLSHGRFIRALALADKKTFSQADWQLIAKTGTSHLFAISGLHLSIVFAMSFGLVRYLSSAVLGSVMVGAARHASTIASLSALAIAVAYSYLAGFSLPTIRALIMLMIIVGASLLKQRLSLPQLIIYCLAAVLIYDPMSVLAISFWLSFGAVCSLLLLVFMVKRQRRHLNSRLQNFRANVCHLLTMQCWLFVTMFGAQLLFFGGVSLIAPLANLVAVPLVSLLVLPLILTAMFILVVFSQPALAGALFAMANQGLVLIFGWLEWLATWQSGWLAGNKLDYWLVILGLISVVVMLKLLNIGWHKVIGVVSVSGVSALVCFTLMTDVPDWSVHFLDVGQGNAAVIERGGHAIIVDTGKSSTRTISELVILPFLGELAITELDYLVLTHQDNDHAGGWRELLKHYPRTQLISNWPDKPGYSPLIDCHQLAGHTISWQQLKLGFFIAPPGFSRSENDNSCVIRFSDSEHSVLFTGDISAKTEAHMVKELGAGWQSEIVQVPHHGSKSSSSKAFIEFIGPQVAIISAGRFNRWHFPDPGVLLNYHHAGVAVATTATSGQISIGFYPHQVPQPRRFRQDIAPFWYNRDLSLAGFWP